MPDYAAPLQRLVLSRTLWLLVVWPAVGLAWQVLISRPHMARARGQTAMRRALASARNAGVACIALALSSTFAHVVVLAGASEDGGALFEHIASGPRFGQLDAQMDLLFDRLSATFCALACLIALGVAIVLAAGPPPNRGWRPWAWLQLSLGGALVTFVADGFVGTAMGWAMVAAAGAWLAGWNNTRGWTVAAMRGAIAIAAMLVGAVLLFWGLGGSWDGDDYAADTPTRFATVRALGWTKPTAGTGSLSLTNAANVELYVDDARTPSMRSPFVGFSLPIGTHALRVRAGDGSNEDSLGRVVFDADTGPLVIVPLGPTLAFRAMADQLDVRDRTGDMPTKRVLESRTGPGGAALVAASLVALLLGAGLMSGFLPTWGAPLPLGALAHGATFTAVGPYMLARVAFLFPLAPNTWIAIESVGAVMLLAAGWRAPAGPAAKRWLAFVGAAPAALAFLALGASGVGATCWIVVLSGAATATLYLAAARGLAFDRGDAVDAADQGTMPQGAVEDLFLVRIPTRLGALLVNMDRWVVNGGAYALADLADGGAWLTATIDEHLIAAPASAVAARVVHLERRVQTAVGASLGRLTWTLLATVGCALVVDVVCRGR
jgi:hypothetical protein